jgi:excisionase family DNA binding protein
MEQLYSYESAAKLLDISVRQLKRLLEEYNLPLAQVGKRVRITESTLKKLVVMIEHPITINFAL